MPIVRASDGVVNANPHRHLTDSTTVAKCSRTMHNKDFTASVVLLICNSKRPICITCCLIYCRLCWRSACLKYSLLPNFMIRSSALAAATSSCTIVPIISRLKFSVASNGNGNNTLPEPWQRQTLHLTYVSSFSCACTNKI